MTSPNAPAMLETALDELDIAHQTLALALVTAHLSAMHSTYTAAIKRLLAFNKQTVTSTRNLLNDLKREPSRKPL